MVIPCHQGCCIWRQSCSLHISFVLQVTCACICHTHPLHGLLPKKHYVLHSNEPLFYNNYFLAPYTHRPTAFRSGRMSFSLSCLMQLSEEDEALTCLVILNSVNSESCTFQLGLTGMTKEVDFQFPLRLIKHLCREDTR